MLTARGLQPAALKGIGAMTAIFRTLTGTLLLLLPALSLASDFRGVEWGATMEQVIEKEGQPKARSDETLKYAVELVGTKMLCEFGFDGGRLVQGAYISLANHMTKNLYVQDYESIKKQLNKKYGAAKVDEQLFSDKLWEGRPDHYGTAVAVGGMIFASEWHTPRTIIHQGLISDGQMGIQHGLIYTEIATYKKREEERERKAADKL